MRLINNIRKCVEQLDIAMNVTEIRSEILSIKLAGVRPLGIYTLSQQSIKENVQSIN